jgi:hypothetical protein
LQSVQLVACTPMNAVFGSDLLTQKAVHEGCSRSFPGSSEHSVGGRLEFYHDCSAAGEGPALLLAFVQADGCRMRLTTSTGGSVAIVAVQAAWLHSPLPTPLRVLASNGGRLA